MVGGGERGGGQLGEGWGKGRGEEDNKGRVGGRGGGELFRSYEGQNIVIRGKYTYLEFLFFQVDFIDSSAV